MSTNTNRISRFYSRSPGAQANLKAANQQLSQIVNEERAAYGEEIDRLRGLLADRRLQGSVGVALAVGFVSGALWCGLGWVICQFVF